VIEETKGVFEYLRASYPGKKGVLLVYARDRAVEHYTVFGESLNAAHRFIREAKKAEEGLHG